MQNAKSVSTPMNYNSVFEQNSNQITSFPFREAVGSLLYLTEKTRPDLSYAVNFCSRKMENPLEQDVTSFFNTKSWHYLSEAVQ